MVASNELVHHVIGLAVSKCKVLPSILWSSCLALCTSHFYSLLPQFLKRGKICLPPRGVARINKLQSTLNNLDKISSDILKHCHDHSITSRCCSSKTREQVWKSHPSLPHGGLLPGQRLTFWYLNYQWFYIKAILLREILSGHIKRLNWHNKRQQAWIIKTF